MVVRRVCLISSQLPPARGSGGIGRLTEVLASGLSRADIDVTVIAAAAPELADESLAGHVTVLRVPVDGHNRATRAAARVAGMGQLRMTIARSSALMSRFEAAHRAKPFDVVEAPFFGAEAISFRPQTGVPLVVRLETPTFVVRQHLGLRPHWTMDWAEARSLRKATRIATLSKTVAAAVASRYGLDKSRLDLCPIGMDPAPPSGPSCSDPVRGLFVGRLEPRKGAEELIRSLCAALQRSPSFVFDIVGSDYPFAPGGSSYEAFASTVLAEADRERVRFHGYIDDARLQSFYRDADFFVAPSRYESFGLVYLEAMRYGLPIIATGRGGASEVVDATCGVIVEPNDIPSLTEAIVRLATNAETRSVLGEGSLRRLRSTFTVERMIDTSLRCYERAVLERRVN